MWLPILGLLIGILVGQSLVIPLPVIFARYLGVAVLAALDSVMGGLRSVLSGKYSSRVLMSGFFVNSLLAAGLTYIGDRMGIDLYYVAIFVFGVRLFNNMAVVRHTLTDLFFGNVPKKVPYAERTGDNV